MSLVKTQDLADLLGLDMDDEATSSKVRIIAERASVFVCAVTSRDWRGEDTVPDRVSQAALSIAARHYLERDTQQINWRLGEYSEGLVDFGKFTAEALTEHERFLLEPWLTKRKGHGSLDVTSMLSADSTLYVAVQGSNEPFPLAEA